MAIDDINLNEDATNSSRRISDSRLGYNNYNETIKLLDEAAEHSDSLAKRSAELKYQLEHVNQIEAAHYYDNLMSDIEKKLHEERLKSFKESGDVLNYSLEKLKDWYDTIKTSTGARNLAGSLVGNLDQLVDRQEQISAHLIGTETTYKKATDTLLDVLTGTGLVDQSKVYDNLYSLTTSGITANVEQRAFLQTLSDDMQMALKANSDALNQITRLQREDSYANRLAIEYSLQSFLNSNYQTSEYIKQMGNVTSQLIQAEALMNSTEALGFESSLQGWLGSLYSAGANQNTISTLAQAIGNISSGDISGLGKGISNLVLMGIARQGMDFGDLLNNNLSSAQTDQIMIGVLNYLQELSGLGSNVVMSQLASQFGINVSDIIAATNVNTNPLVNASASDFLNSINRFDIVGLPKFAKNLIGNLGFSTSMEVANNPLIYGIYKTLDAIAGTKIGDVLQNSHDPIKSTIGTAINLSPLAAVAFPFIETLLNAVGSLTNGSFWDANNIYNALGESNSLGSVISVSGGGVSSGLYYGNQGGLYENSTNSLNDSLETLGVQGEQTIDYTKLISEDVSELRYTLSNISDRLEAINYALENSI